MPELISVTVEAAAEGRVRLVGEVRAGGGNGERYWYEVPAEHADSLARTGNPWAVALLPLAVTLRSPLRLSLPIDPALASNLRRVMQIWAEWYPGVRPVPLDAEEQTTTAAAAPATAAFFSGGVDSFFTVLRHADDIDDLLTVDGLDIALCEQEALRRLRYRHHGVAEALGLRLVPIATNLRETGWRRTDWAGLAHGCALASVALVLGGRYRQALLASGSGHHDPHPWGSHPRTDPLLSTSRTEIVHDGAASSRLKKLTHVARSAIALDALRVCWRSGDDRNCGRCAKCYRTMVGLELLGVLPEAGLFVADHVDPRLAARIFAGNSWHRRDMTELRELAREQGRPELARAIARAIRGSRRRAVALDVLGALEARGLPARWTRPVRSALLRAWLP